MSNDWQMEFVGATFVGRRANAVTRTDAPPTDRLTTAASASTEAAAADETDATKRHMSDHDFTFDDGYDESVELTDGTEVHLRLLRPEDRDELRRGFQRLSTESRYRRFLSPKSRLSETELEYLTDIDQENHVALVALLTDGDRDGDGIAVARCIRLRDEPRTAEAAVTVVDEFHGRGLGGLLLQRLVEAALERGIETFRASLFAENVPMRRLLEEIGPVEVIENTGPVVTVVVSLRADETRLAPATPERDEPPKPSRDSPVRRILSATARGTASLVDKFRWNGDDEPE